MTALTYTCTKCGKTCQARKADDVLALLGLCAEHQAERVAAGRKRMREAEKP